MAMLRSLLLLFTVFSMGNAQDTAGVKCRRGWTYFVDRCFKFFSHQVNWITAERNCQSLDANLASVRNELENDFLLNLLPLSSTRCWIGAHDAVQEGEWLWSDGAPYDYTNWCLVEPEDLGSNENCGEINWTSKSVRCWNDRDCSNSIGYVCAKDL